MAEKKPAATPRRGRIKLAFHEQECEIDEVFEIPYIGSSAPEVHIIGIDKVESSGQAHMVNRWRYCLVWR